jgi:glycosyltransferase involved in cell wall biosynthesis
VVAPPGLLPLGALRNLSLAEARGELWCQWDDDDLYHPERLAAQQVAMAERGAASVLLAEVMQFSTADRSLCLTNWRATEAGGFPGSIMCRRDVALRYPEARLGEDSAALRQLGPDNLPALLAEQPWLYVYVTHGGNSWPAEHHQMLRQELAISRGLLARREVALRQGLAPIDFGPGQLRVAGYNGEAFTLG